MAPAREFRAEARWVRSAPRKAQLVVSEIRGRPAPDAVTVLRFMTRAAARDVEKVLKSAIANAESHPTESYAVDQLYVSAAYVGYGPDAQALARPSARPSRTDQETHLSHHNPPCPDRGHTRAPRTVEMAEHAQNARGARRRSSRRPEAAVTTAPTAEPAAAEAALARGRDSGRGGGEAGARVQAADRPEPRPRARRSLRRSRARALAQARGGAAARGGREAETSSATEAERAEGRGVVVGQKVHPGGLRVGIIHDWKSNWYTSTKDFPRYLMEDVKIRDHIQKQAEPCGALGHPHREGQAADQDRHLHRAARHRDRQVGRRGRCPTP